MMLAAWRFSGDQCGSRPAIDLQCGCASTSRGEADRSAALTSHAMGMILNPQAVYVAQACRR